LITKDLLASFGKTPVFEGGRWLPLNARGKTRPEVNLAEWLAQATAPLREAPLTHEIVLPAPQQPLPHQNPADRFLAATAQVMDLTLVTSDDNLLGLGTFRAMKNREGV
jgi:PIN domain nuclease of toxin-antitoxin system